MLFVDGARSGRASTCMKGDKIQHQAGGERCSSSMVPALGPPAPV